MKDVARCVIEDMDLRWKSQPMLEWYLCASINWSRNQTINESGYSLSQWVLGRGLKLPADLLSPMGRLDTAIKAHDQPRFMFRLHCSLQLNELWPHNVLRSPSHGPRPHVGEVRRISQVLRSRGSGHVLET